MKKFDNYYGFVSILENLYSLSYDPKNKILKANFQNHLILVRSVWNLGYYNLKEYHPKHFTKLKSL